MKNVTFQEVKENAIASEGKSCRKQTVENQYECHERANHVDQKQTVENQYECHNFSV